MPISDRIILRYRRGFIVYSVLAFATVSCVKDIDGGDSPGPHIFKSGEEIEMELNVKGNFIGRWEYENSDMDPHKTFMLSLSPKSDFSLKEFWYPLNAEDCNAKLKEVFLSRSSSVAAYPGIINSSFVYYDDPLMITCDHEIFGVPPGNNLSSFFIIRWQNLEIHSNVRVNSPDLVVIPITKEFEPADEFFRKGDCIPKSFYIYTTKEADMHGLTIKIEIPVQIEYFYSYIKDLQSGNKDAIIHYQKDTLHATIEY